MASLPSGSVEVDKVATPFVTLEVPSVVVPLANVTVPVTLFGRVSVRTTGLPGSDVVGEEVNVDAGVALATA